MPTSQRKKLEWAPEPYQINAKGRKGGVSCNQEELSIIRTLPMCDSKVEELLCPQLCSLIQQGKPILPFHHAPCPHFMSQLSPSSSSSLTIGSPENRDLGRDSPAPAGTGEKQAGEPFLAVGCCSGFLGFFLSSVVLRGR